MNIKCTGKITPTIKRITIPFSFRLQRSMLLACGINHEAVRSTQRLSRPSIAGAYGRTPYRPLVLRQQWKPPR